MNPTQATTHLATTHLLKILLAPLIIASFLLTQCTGGTVATKSDLSLENLLASAQQVGVDSEFRVSLTVVNRGTAATGDNLLSFYHSTDDINFTPVISELVISPLAAGGFRNSYIKIQPESQGTYYYGACITKDANEEKVFNNCTPSIRVVVLDPLLTGFGLENISTSPNEVQLGETISISVDLINSGEYDAAGALKYYRSLNERISGLSDTQIDSLSSTDIIAPNARRSFTTDITTASMGTYYYGVCVFINATEDVSAGNCSTGVKVVVTTNTAELVLENLSTSSTTISKGDPFTLSVIVQNDGVASSKSGIITYYRSINRTISNSDASIQTAGFIVLGAGEQETSSVLLEAYDYGRYYYGACLGTSNQCTAGIKIAVLATATTGAAFSACNFTTGGVDLALDYTVVPATITISEFSSDLGPGTKTLPANQIDHFGLDIRRAGYLRAWTTAENDTEGKLLKGDCTEGNYDYLGDISSSNSNFKINAETAVGKYILVVYGKNLVAINNFKLNIAYEITPGTVAVDRLLSEQWHLDNNNLVNINVEEAWAITEGDPSVIVSVVDDGASISHPDLINNHYDGYSYNYITGGSDPDLPNSSTSSSHGNAVTGIIVAEKDNGIGISGIAPDARFRALNLLEKTTDVTLITSITRNKDIVAVSNNSWGSGHPGTFIKKSRAWKIAIEDSVENGFGGKGIVYLFSAGNSHTVNSSLSSNTNYKESRNIYATGVICAVGDNGTRAYYSELGANLLVCGPSNGGSRGITTTDLPGARGYRATDYTDSFGGTSAATPMVAGVVALMRSANRDLGWRDVFLILAKTAQKIDASDFGWLAGYPSYDGTDYTGETYNFNHKYGFGLVDAGAAVKLAQNWNNVPVQVIGKHITKNIPPAEQSVPGNLVSALVVSGVNTTIDFVEYVEIDLILQSSSYEKLAINLIDPNGAISNLVVPHSCFFIILRINCYLSTETSVIFGSNRHNGITPDGTWQLGVTGFGINHKLVQWGLKFYGHKKP